MTRFIPTTPSALTAGQLAHAARTVLWPPALALANTFAGPSVAEWAAAYVEATACLCGSAGWPDFEAEVYVNRAAEAVGIALTDADRDTLAEATREAEAAGVVLAETYDVGMRRRR